MNRTLKRLLLISVILVMGFSVFAGGTPEVSGNELQSAPMDPTTMANMESGDSWSGLFLQNVANIYDKLTYSFCLSMTPFPGALLKFWTNPYQNEPVTISNNLMIGDTYWTDVYENMKSPNSEMKVTVMGSDGSDMEMSGSVSRTALNQRRSWSMVQVLFITFLAAEILFSTIYGYMTDREGGVLKDIISKTFMCLLLMLLASALPFLVEAFREGFAVMARQISGIEEKYDSANIHMRAQTDPGSLTKEEKILYMMNEGMVFQYPGIVCRNLAYVIELTDPNYIGLYNTFKEDDGIILGSLQYLLIKLIYMLVRLVCTVLIVFSALHVMLNIVEVYLLLGIVICVMPFAVFSPLKFLGEKAVMSLFANLMELFVLMVIIFTTLTVANSTLYGLFDTLAFAPSDFYIQMKNVTYKQASELFGSFSLDDLPQDISSTDVAYSFIQFEASQDTDSLNHAKNTSYKFPEVKISITTQTASNGAVVKAWLDADDMAELFKESFESYEFDYKYTISLIEDLNDASYSDAKSFIEDNIEFDGGAKSTITCLTLADAVPWLYNLYENMSNIVNQPDNELVAGSTEWTASSPSGDKWEIVFIHLAASIMCIYMQTYFINQSSTITNAVLSGNVSSEGFTAAIGKMMAGKAAGMAIKAGTGAAKTGMQAIGGAGRAAAAASAAQNMHRSGGAPKGFWYAMQNAAGGGEDGKTRQFFDSIYGNRRRGDGK